MRNLKARSTIQKEIRRLVDIAYGNEVSESATKWEALEAVAALRWVLSEGPRPSSCYNKREKP